MVDYRESDAELQRGLEPPQFTLRAVFVTMLVICILLALAASLGPYVAAVATLFALAVFAHVAGAALGTQLRDSGSRRLPTDRANSASVDRGSPVADDAFAPVTRLQRREELGWPIIMTTMIGVLGGAIGGVILLLKLNWENANVGGVAVGGVAAGVLGGIWTFAGSSFLQVALGAWVQASRTPSDQED